MIFNSLTEFKANIAENTKILCLDMGEARIGLAISDPRHVVANPFEVYKRQNTNKDLGYINRICSQENISAIVIGLPLSLDGAEEENCTKVRIFADKILRKINLPIFFQDERMSTAAVTRSMQEADISRKKRQEVDDKLAAAYILQIVLDSL